jgi:2-methylisocitrate lyase-like PEP mutase family enzyme
MPRCSIRKKLDDKEFFVAPGAHDMMSALMLNRVGFDVAYASGYWLTASAYGIPDVGIATYTQMLDRVGMLARTVDAALIADADTGYGGLLNVHHTIRGYEAAGVRAIQIEDQQFPKKCGHTPNKQLITLDEMVRKIRVACDARVDPHETLIIARTDARQGEGVAGALRRAEAYARAGADILFVEALETEAEMRQACEALDTPMLANMADGGITPILPAAELEQIGYACAIFPATTAMPALHAAEQSLRYLKDTGTTVHPDNPKFDFREFCRVIGFEEIWAFDRQWAE